MFRNIFFVFTYYTIELVIFKKKGEICMKVGFVGGDLRQLTTLKLFEKDGHDVKIYGYDNIKESVDSFDEIKDSDVIIFPLPTCNGEFIFSPMTEKKIHISDIDLKSCKLIFYAGANDELSNKLMSSGALCINYLSDEELVLKNAIATAEGTLDIVINETAETVFGSKALILGFGRVAKATAKLFSCLGSCVTVACRRRVAASEAYCMGYNTLYLNQLKSKIEDFDIIINTIPALVLNRDILSNVSKSSLIIDLASKPGGVDFDSAKELGKKVIWALSIPGKVAPVSSGKIIYETIVSILEELEEEWHET